MERIVKGNGLGDETYMPGTESLSLPSLFGALQAQPEESILFMERIFNGNGLGDETYMPGTEAELEAGLGARLDMARARREAEDVFTLCVGEAFKRTGEWVLQEHQHWKGPLKTDA